MPNTNDSRNSNDEVIEIENEKTDGTDHDDGDDATALAAAADAKAIERQARAQGWRPEGEFKGEDGKWVDAATFVDRGNRFKKRQEKEIETLKAQIAATDGKLKDLAKFHKEAMAGKAKELDNAIRKAKVDRQTAIRNGEDDDALLLDDRIDTLKEEKTKLEKEAAEEPAKQTPAEAAAKALPQAALDNPILSGWIEDGNEWFRDDHKLRAYAMAAGDELRADGDESTGLAFLRKVRAAVEADFPAKFRKGNPLRDKAGSVEGGGKGAPTGAANGRTAKDLPDADRALMRTFVADGLLTEKQFLADYNW